MHANIVHTSIDMAQIDAAVDGISAVKDRLGSMPGFSGAYWFAPIEGRGLMVSFWEDESAATAAAVPVGFSPAPGVTVAQVESRSVLDRA